jgi:hypothetical protein
MLTPHNKFDQDDSNTAYKPQNTNNHKKKDAKAKRRAVLEALLAKLFASITTIKAGYAELQMAQNPYCSDAIQASDQAVVDELKQLSQLKRSFFKNELDLSPQVTMMLAEIQEQQGLMKTYEITIKKLEAGVEVKGSDIGSLKKQLDEAIAFNKSLEKRKCKWASNNVRQHSVFTPKSNPFCSILASCFKVREEFCETNGL